MVHSEAQNDMDNQVADSAQLIEGGIHAWKRNFSVSNQDEHAKTDNFDAIKQKSASYTFDEVKHDTDGCDDPDDSGPYQARGNSQDVGENGAVQGISALNFSFDEHGMLTWDYSLSLH